MSAARTQDYWYQYDAMNRFTVTMGVLSTGARGTSAGDASVGIVKGSSGVAIAYDMAGQRKQAINGSDGSLTNTYYTDATDNATQSGASQLALSVSVNGTTTSSYFAYDYWSADARKNA